MVNRILVPLDGSDRAERAVPIAQRLAVATGATLHLVQILEPLPPAAYGAIPLNYYIDMGELRQKALAYLEGVQARLTGARVPSCTALLTGYPASALLEYEQEAAIDLVVLASHGRTGLARFVLGSVAERLLRHGTAPVLLVRAFGAPAGLTTAVVPLDGSPQAEQALAVAEQLLPRLSTAVTLLRVIASPDEAPEATRYLELRAVRLQQAGLACRSVVLQGDPAQTLIETAGEEALVVMATHGRAALARWALGSVADRVVHGGASAVLLVRIRESTAGIQP